ncbi:MAG: 3-dehydroquinate synthase [Pseudomonadales bacterium]|nr:3-dehydroquinate synthase [Pseudomonadales bacterium]
MHETLTVELGSRTYPIYIGNDTFSHENFLTQHIKGKQVFIVSNATVAKLYMPALLKVLNTVYQADTYLIPDGEQYKTLETYSRVIDELMRKRHNRSTTLIALGGGVIGDITGFVAATYQRGVGFLQIPTTLLAQVDSSVGGKTGVNHPDGKNMIGAFYQPSSVFIDVDALRSLPEREFSAGLAEVVKYGVIWDAGFFSWLEGNMQALLAKDRSALVTAIKMSCKIKALIVSEDEREEGVRAILNFGHTFGHALERMTRYTQFLHGEAVSIGMVMAADLSRRLGWLSCDDVSRLENLLEAGGLPTKFGQPINTTEMLSSMGMDKKVVDGKLRLVLAKTLGSAQIVESVDSQMLRDALISNV